MYGVFGKFFVFDIALLMLGYEDGYVLLCTIHFLIPSRVAFLQERFADRFYGIFSIVERSLLLQIISDIRRDLNFTNLVKTEKL